jgi:hypothetical protein
MTFFFVLNQHLYSATCNYAVLTSREIGGEAEGDMSLDVSYRGGVARGYSKAGQSIYRAWLLSKIGHNRADHYPGFQTRLG